LRLMASSGPSACGTGCGSMMAPRSSKATQVSVVVSGGRVRVHHAGAEVACHDKRLGRRERAVDRAHLHGIVSGKRKRDGDATPGQAQPSKPLPSVELLRLLAEYEQMTGGGW